MENRSPRFRCHGWIVTLLASGVALAADRVLIFTKTSSTRENNIADTRSALKKFYETKGLLVDTSENAALISDTGLAHYKSVIFLKTTGDFLNNSQQDAFESWFKKGGSAQFIHAALDAETNWVFYGKLIGGAYFQSLPGDSNTTHTIVVEDSTDPSTKGMPKRWSRIDEIYGFRANPRSASNPSMRILTTVDESSFPKGKPGTDHPMTWSCSYLGGKAWTTAMGHITPPYRGAPDSTFLNHLWGGMVYLLNIQEPTSTLQLPASKHRRKNSWDHSTIKSALRRFGPKSEKDARGRER